MLERYWRHYNIQMHSLDNVQSKSSINHFAPWKKNWDWRLYCYWYSTEEIFLQSLASELLENHNKWLSAYCHNKWLSAYCHNKWLSDHCHTKWLFDHPQFPLLIEGNSFFISPQIVYTNIWRYIRNILVLVMTVVIKNVLIYCTHIDKGVAMNNYIIPYNFINKFLWFHNSIYINTYGSHTHVLHVAKELNITIIFNIKMYSWEVNTNIL